MSLDNTKNNLWLFKTLSVRAYSERYKGSLLGFAWPFVYILIMLAIYSTVFSLIFNARWQQVGVDVPEAAAPFWIVLLAGMLPHQLLSEVLSQSPGQILSVPSYVKKIKFPLLILSPVAYVGFLFNCLIGVGVLIVAAAWAGFYHWTVLLVPLVFVQMSLWCVGLGWLLGALGVFFRDLQQMTGLVVTILLFATPIFYSPQVVPPNFRIVMLINPLAHIVETLRGLVIWGLTPDWFVFIGWSIGAALFALLSFYIFQRLRPSFADVM